MSKERKEPKTFGFTLTSAEGSNSYVMCIKSYEPIDEETKKLVAEKLGLSDSDELYFPKCYCILTKYPFYMFMKSLLKEIFYATSRNKKYATNLIAFALRSSKHHQTLYFSVLLLINHLLKFNSASFLNL